MSSELAGGEEAGSVHPFHGQLHADLLPRRVPFVAARHPDEYYDAPSEYPVTVLNPWRLKEQTAENAKAAAAAAAAAPAAAAAAAGAADDEPAPPSRHLFPPARRAGMLGWRSVAGAGPGVANLGNTCFLNSVLQCLTYAPPLANLCLDGVHSASCAKAKGDAGFCAFCELEKHVAAAHTLRKKTLVPRALVQRIRSIARHFRPGRQEDAHEFFLRLIERMEEAARAARQDLPPAVAQTSEASSSAGASARSSCARAARAPPPPTRRSSTSRWSSRARRRCTRRSRRSPRPRRSRARTRTAASAAPSG